MRKMVSLDYLDMISPNVLYYHMCCILRLSQNGPRGFVCYLGSDRYVPVETGYSVGTDFLDIDSLAENFVSVLAHNPFA